MNKHIVLMKFKSSSFIKKVGVLLCFVAFALSANAQTRKVTGQIVDESGQPIIGATIRLQDATTGRSLFAECAGWKKGGNILYRISETSNPAERRYFESHSSGR